MRQLKIIYKFLIFIPVFLFIYSCPDASAFGHAGEQKKDIVIGIVYSSSYSNFFLEGINMALEEINQSGGILEKKIKTIVYDDKSDVGTAENIASRLSENDEVVAVIGHESSSVAIPASVFYEKAGIVFISPGSTIPDLTLYGSNFTFRNIPDNKIFGRKMAEYAARKGAKKMLIFYERSDVNKNLSEVFREYAPAMGIDIVATRSYFEWEEDFRNTIATVKKEYKFDFVLIAGSLPSGGILVRQLREMDVNVPIMGGDGLDSSDVAVIAGDAAENIIVPTVFYSEYPNKLTRNFVRQFEDRYGFVPDTWAAQGYDALSVLAFAIEKGRSADPIVISTTLRFLENWKGVTGTYSFTSRGDIRGKDIFFKTIKNGNFVYVDQQLEYESDLFNYIEDYTLRLPLKREITTIDPGFAGDDSVSTEIIEQLFLGLTDLDPETYETVPELATKWSVSENGKVYLFYMRNDAVWTNGKPVTAHDVVWTIRRNINPDTKSPDTRALYVLKNAKAINTGQLKDLSKIGVHAPNDFMVMFTLEYPVPYFPKLVSQLIYRPLPKEIIEKHKDKWTEPENIQNNGTYKLVLWEKGRGMFLKKNPDYYDAKKVAIPEIRYYVIPQPSLGMAMYVNNELDIMGSSYLRLPSAAIPRVKKDPVLKDEYSEYPHFCTYGYAFNATLPPVDNPLVRKAISAAIDRQLLIDAVNEGNGEVATTCTRPPAFGFVAPEEGIGISFDPLKAREWLAEAGYPDGKDFPEITILYNSSDFHKRIAYAIQEFLKHYLEIAVKLQGEDDDKYDALLSQGNVPHMFRAKMCPDYPDADGWMSLFHPSGVYSVGWENQEFTEIVDNARKESDPKQRKSFYKRAEQILCEEEAVAIPLYFEIYHCMVKPRVKGWYHMAIGGQHVLNWSFDKN